MCDAVGCVLLHFSNALSKCELYVSLNVLIYSGYTDMSQIEDNVDNASYNSNRECSILHI